METTTRARKRIAQTRRELDKTRKEVDARAAARRKAEADHRRMCEKKYLTVAEGTKNQRDALYKLAWDYGHAHGWEDVESYYADMADLLLR